MCQWRNTRGDTRRLRWRWAASSSSTQCSVWCSLVRSGTQVSKMFTIGRRRKFVDLISVSQINARHHFLARFIGTFPEEDVSYNKANEVQVAVTVTTCMCCVLEFGFYFLYNRMVNNKMFKNLTSYKISLGPSLAPNHLWRCS